MAVRPPADLPAAIAVLVERVPETVRQQDLTGSSQISVFIPKGLSLDHFPANVKLGAVVDIAKLCGPPRGKYDIAFLQIDRMQARTAIEQPALVGVNCPIWLYQFVRQILMNARLDTLD